jgi:methylglutamate dehydrogenase subunit D
VANPLIVTERSGLRLATVMARKGINASVLGDALGFLLPDGPIHVERDGVSWIGTGPATWLAMTAAPTIDWPTSLEQKLKGLVSISDQSGSYRIFRMAGDDARLLLQRGAFIDLHPNVFREDSAATTVIAHIGVILWRVGDPCTFEVATFRSYAPSFLRSLEAMSASFSRLPPRAMRF